jgi:leucyl aminopeptidase
MKFLYTTDKEKLNKGIIVVRVIEAHNTELVLKNSNSRELDIGCVRAKVSMRSLRIIARTVVRASRERKLGKIAILIEDFVFPQISEGAQEHALGQMLAENFVMANYDFNKLKTKPKTGWGDIETLTILGYCSPDFKKGIEKGKIIGDEINACRDLANTPGGAMTPTMLARGARGALKHQNVRVTVYGKKEMLKLGMGAILGVSAGSSEEPKFIILEYYGNGNKEKNKNVKLNERPIVLAGKGVTFDSGGLNLKPDNGIYEMHMDMSGGASVIHAISLASRLGLKKNIIGLIPAVENMPSGSSYRPGDILHSLSGKTIEILNTDAEGRVILADALSFALRYNPRAVFSVATLTGASLIALGEQASAIMTRDQEMENSLRQFGEECGDYVWPFPLWEEYEDMVKGCFADVANVPAEGNSRYAGVIGGGMFLLQFTEKYAKDCVFAHIDMSPKMTSAKGEQLAKGASGAPIRLLLKILENI